MCEVSLEDYEMRLMHWAGHYFENGDAELETFYLVRAAALGNQWALAYLPLKLQDYVVQACSYRPGLHCVTHIHVGRNGTVPDAILFADQISNKEWEHILPIAPLSVNRSCHTITLHLPKWADRAKTLADVIDMHRYTYVTPYAKLLLYATHVCRALVVLHSHGFVHPAVSNPRFAFFSKYHTLKLGRLQAIRRFDSQQYPRHV